MRMTVIFSNVQAEIADDLISKFPNEFDFDAMLIKVCEDAEVVIESESESVDNKQQQNYKLKGQWLSMDKAYRHLVTTLAMYGSRLGEDVTATTIDIKNSDLAEILEYPITDFVGKDVDKEKKDNSGVSACKDNKVSRSVLEDSKNKKTRRPRKSAVQSRKLITSITSNEYYNEDEDNECEASEMNVDDVEDVNEVNSHVDLENSAGKENDSKLMFEDGKGAVEGICQRGKASKSKVECINKPSVRKRGRPKKYCDDVSEFPCSQCSFVAKERCKLRTHMRRMHLSDPTTCGVCEKVFPSKRHMMRHKVCHAEPQHCCDVCGKMYKVKKAMVDHRKTHESTYEKPSVKCGLCPKSFCSQYILDCHVRDIHEGLKKSYLCSVCGKSFTTKHSLHEHSNAHIGMKPYTCEVCGKTFSYESALRDHKYTHLGSKQFWCKHCQKGFSQRSGLKMHMRTHRLQKMFTCTECGRGFTQKQALQRHERVHKGEKPFICKHCGRFFTDASIIRRHLILVHKIDKAANVWREDIICTIVANTDHHVQKIGEDDKVLNIEKQKEEVLQNVGLHNKSKSKKGPSRAFHRIYPRRVAILDEEDNVISLPDVSASATVSSSDFISGKIESTTAQTGNVALQLKPLTSQSLSDIPAMGATESGIDMDAQILTQRFMDQNQWEAFTSQLNKGTTTTHLEHIILEDPNQSERANLDQVQNLQKIIKCETVQNVVGEPNTSMQHEEYQHASQSPRYSPVSFNTLGLSNNAKALEGHFEALTSHITGQYYDRGSSHSTMPWAYYCSHLPNHLGITINSDFSYISTASSSATGSVDGHQMSSTSLVIHKPGQEMGCESSSYQHTNIIPSNLDSTSPSCVQNIPALLESNPLQGQKDEISGHSAQATSIILNPELSGIAQTHESSSSNLVKCDSDSNTVQDSVEHFLEK